MRIVCLHNGPAFNGDALETGGLGGTEAVLAGLLVVTGAPPPEAMAATAITRVATLWFAVVIGAVALPALELAGRRGTKTAPESAVPALGGGRSSR